MSSIGTFVMGMSAWAGLYASNEYFKRNDHLNSGELLFTLFLPILCSCTAYGFFHVLACTPFSYLSVFLSMLDTNVLVAMGVYTIGDYIYSFVRKQDTSVIMDALFSSKQESPESDGDDDEDEDDDTQEEEQEDQEEQEEQEQQEQTTEAPNPGDATVPESLADISSISEKPDDSEVAGTVVSTVVEPAPVAEAVTSDVTI
jgi:hypothetical protein